MNKPIVTVVDTGVGNLYSLCSAIREVGGHPSVSDSHKEISKASLAIIPGVGSFSSTMERFNQLGIASALRDLHSSGIRILGICLGMQLMVTEGNEGGKVQGLALMRGRTVPIPNVSSAGRSLRLPHIGWSSVSSQAFQSGAAWFGESGQAFDSYFAHSFTVTGLPDEAVAATFSYGGYELVAALKENNLFGTQFHPEKSGRKGLETLKNFISS